MVILTELEAARLLFDETYYLSANPDVREAISGSGLGTAWQHFAAFGAAEGRNPSVGFDTVYYLNENPDVAAAVASEAINSPFAHYILFGKEEGRAPVDPLTGLIEGTSLIPEAEADLFASRDAGELFDETYYLTNNLDVAAALAGGTFESGREHFILYGAAEGRNPSESFDTSYYLEQNSDVAAALVRGAIASAFGHYVRFGREEGRFGTQPPSDTLENSDRPVSNVVGEEAIVQDPPANPTATNTEQTLVDLRNWPELVGFAIASPPNPTDSSDRDTNNSGSDSDANNSGSNSNTNNTDNTGSSDSDSNNTDNTGSSDSGSNSDANNSDTNNSVTNPVTLEFTSANFSVNEGDGNATIAISRTGGSDGEVSVDYAIATGGTATAGTDYTTTNGTLTFADGETSKTFSIPIADDADAESDETVELSLSNAVGGNLGSDAMATLTILDDDAVSALPAAIDSSFVGFSPGDSEAAIAATSAQRLTIGTQTIYIGTHQATGINQNPIIASFDSANPANNWVRNDYESTGADGRGFGLFWDGTNLYGVFSIDGTQGSSSEDFRRATTGATQNWLKSYGSGGGAKVSVLARIDPATGEMTEAAYLSARLSSGNSNTLTVTDISTNASGNLVVQARSFFSPRNPDGSRMTQVVSGSSPFDYTVEITPDLTTVVSTSAVGWVA